MTAELNLADLGFPEILKSEIEDKLKELDVYIDEELPDYILVLLANKKSQQQMCKDLRLFFGSLTETFVEWVQNRAKGLKISQNDDKEDNSKTKEVDETNSEVKTKQNRKLSLHSDQKSDSNPPSVKKKSPPLSSPKSKKSDSSVRDQLTSLGKRKSRSPEPTPKPRKSRIYQEVTDYLTSSRRRVKTFDTPNTQVSTAHSNDINMVRSPDGKMNTSDTKTPVSKRPSTWTTIQPFRTEMVTPPPSRLFETERNKSVSPVRETRTRERIRGRERENSGERERKEEKRRFRSRSTPLSPILRKPMEELPRRNKNQVRLRYFNTSARSPSPPLRTHPQLSSVVKIKSSNRIVRGVRNSGSKDEQKGSIRLVHKALSEAAASTARSLHRNVGSPKKRKPVMSRLGPQVDNSSLVREVRITPEKKRNSVVQAESYSKRNASSKQTNFSDLQPEESSQGIDPINAQFDIIKLSRNESTCSISDDDLFPPRENSPMRKIQTNNTIASSDHDSSMFDSEEVLPIDAIPHKRKVLPLKTVTKPKFIVTLDGAQQQYRKVVTPGGSINPREKRASIGKIDIKQRLGNKPAESPEELTTPIYNPPDISPLSESLKSTTIKPKTQTSTPKPTDPLTERCKFWPNCKLGDKCDFHHPSLPCKNFPYCKFNQKCHYVHPDCKFDPYCTKPDCPFLHKHPPRNSFPNHFKSTFSYTPDNKSSFPTRSQLTWTPGQKNPPPKEKDDDATRHISERKFALEEVQTVLIPKNET